MKKLIDRLNSCGFSAQLAQTKEEALKLAKEFIKPNISIGLGGSVSIGEIGLLDYLVETNYIKLFNQYEKGISMQENTKRRRQGLITDLYITSTNAVSLDGNLINVDGSGNRVAALNFGPEKVLLIIGKNKIVKTIEDGRKRILEVAAKKNIERMNAVAVENGKEPRFNLDNIANKFSRINGDEKGRINIILVEENLGY